jgi:glycosyltransferase involved in cell wall biosynthesis
MFKKARQFIESGRFDIIHAAFYYMGRYAVDKKISIPKKTAAVLDTHNIEYLVYSRFARLAKNPVKKALVCLEAFRIKKYEIPIYAKFDKCIAFSQLDKENITGLSGASNIVVNPSCIEPAYGGEGPPSHEEKNTIIFFGLLNTPANDDAVRFFCRRIFPEVRKRIPDAKFLIAGKYPSGYVVRLTRDPAIKVLGLISDMKGLLERAALVVVPLRLGGGIRIKILEAWACGKAVVSTAVGAEGVEVADGKDIVIADSPIDFANKVVELLGDDAKRKELGQAALKKVREYYTPERIVKNLETIYKQALAEKTAK